MKKNSQAFANQLVICLLVTMTFGGSIGLGTVWVRHQNSLIAKTNQLLARRIAAVERRSEELTTQIQTRQSPVLLRQLNESMRLGLVPMTADDIPVLHVTENPMRRLLERANQEAYRESDTTAAPVTFRVALR